MALVMNALPHQVTVQVGGNYFEFKPEQIKLIHNDNIAHLMCTDKAYLGLVGVPDVVVEAPTSEESKQIKAEAKKKGVAARISHLEKIKHNLLVSLQRDLEMSNIKASPLSYASEGEKAAIAELASYAEASNAEKEKEVAELEKLISKTNKK